MEYTQKIFDKVAIHLLIQNEKSLNEQGKCAYRGVDGRMCAVGCLIADKHYHPDLEGLEGFAVGIYQVRKALELSIERELSEAEMDMINEMQYIHDAVRCGLWRDRFVVVASRFRLNHDLLKLIGKNKKAK